MEEKEYKYDAFISYRHCELDKFVAEKLHHILETYKLPKNVKKKLNIKNRPIKRVFRDQDELPLTSNLEDPIIDALNNSKYLIVICSPRLKDSLWCKKEIETFKKIRGRKNIFCVLIEGEPSDSFPEEVLYDEEEKLVDGKMKKVKVMVEPLAADVRGKNKKQVLKKIKSEKLRLIAPMFNLDYDDLKQRHKIWKQKKIIASVVIIAILSFLFAIYSITMFIIIQLQQNVLAENQATFLSNDAMAYLKNDNRYDAVYNSYQALTTYDDIKMPYTPEAEYALVESLGLYDIGLSYKAINEVKTKGIANYLKSSPDYKYAATYDGSETITLFDSSSLNIIAEYKVDEMYISEYAFTFIGNDKFAYINKKGNINIVNIKDGKQIKEIKNNGKTYKALKGDSIGNNLAYVDLNTLYIYNIKTNKVLSTIPSKEDYFSELYFSTDGDYLFAETDINNYDINKEDTLTLHVISIKEQKEINSLTINAGYIEGVVTKGNNAYILLNDMLGAEFNMLVLSYDYINNSINWQKEANGNWGKYIIKSYKEGTNEIAVVNNDTINILDANTGSLIQTFNTDSEIINIYAYTNNNLYLVFSAHGRVSYINMDNGTNIVINGRYELNLDNYIKVTPTATGFLLIPGNANRVILYEAKANPKAKKENIELDTISDDSISIIDYEKVSKEYKLKNKSLIAKIFYDTKKETLFVSYKNGDLNIYNTKDKKILKSLEEVGSVNHYFGKDKNNRIYIGDVSDSYILDKNYNKVGHIKGLAKLEKDKVIIKNNNDYYSLKIYELKDILKEAKQYLKENKVG
ncbi:MAG: toll/interleukin-1 receptor domain-containing protein [Bacilli bacterium]|nr:toll/interleukin-1 receptor domain-containing protein [Bacilli bacterium]